MFSPTSAQPLANVDEVLPEKLGACITFGFSSKKGSSCTVNNFAHNPLSKL